MLKKLNCLKRRCKHFIGIDQSNGNELTEKVVCKAFPKGIPSMIVYGINKHLKPLPGQDNDIVYEKE